MRIATTIVAIMTICPGMSSAETVPAYDSRVFTTDEHNVMIDYYSVHDGNRGYIGSDYRSCVMEIFVDEFAPYRREILVGSERTILGSLNLACDENGLHVTSR